MFYISHKVVADLAFIKFLNNKHEFLNLLDMSICWISTFLSCVSVGSKMYCDYIVSTLDYCEYVLILVNNYYNS